MFTLNELFLILGILVPLAFAPGAATISCFVSGSNFGLIKSIPYILGLQIIPLVYSLLVGFGAGYILTSYPVITLVLKYLGIAYVFYLAFLFFRSSSKFSLNVDSPLKLHHGFLLQLLNPSSISIIVMIMSQFIHDGTNNSQSIILLSLLIVAVKLTAYLSWTIASILIKQEQDSFLSRYQDKLCGSMLFICGIFMIV